MEGVVNIALIFAGYQTISPLCFRLIGLRGWVHPTVHMLLEAPMVYLKGREGAAGLVLEELRRRG